MNACMDAIIDDSAIIQRPSDVDILNGYIDTAVNHAVDAHMAERLQRDFCSKMRAIARSAPRTASFDLQDDEIAGFLLTLERRYPHSRLHWKGTFTRNSESLTLTGYLDYQAGEEKQINHTIDD